MQGKSRIVAVTGANRGLGLEICRQMARLNHKVLMTSRNASKGEAAAERLATEGLEVIFHPLDVTQADSVAALGSFVRSRFGRVDVLINNAGIFPDAHSGEDSASGSVFTASLDGLRGSMEVNLFGPLMLAQELVPLMKQHGYGRIVNVSSGMGQLQEMGGHFPAYRCSKTALNALTRILAAETSGTGILVNSVCPGWVRTDMGGPSAERSLEEGVAGIIWAATLADDGPTGGFFRDGKPIPW